MTDRSRARELALQILFQREFSESWDVKGSIQTFKENFRISENVIAYAESLVLGVVEHQSEISEKVKAATKNWSLDRMSMVDRNILSIAYFEATWGDVPKKVAINESIELAKKYSGTESSGFINGVLDQLLYI